MAEIINFVERSAALKSRRVPEEAAVFNQQASLVGKEVTSTAQMVQRSLGTDAAEDFLDMHDDLNGLAENLRLYHQEDAAGRIAEVRNVLQQAINRVSEASASTTNNQ